MTLFAHGGLVGLVVEIGLVVVGLGALAALVWVGARRKIDEYEHRE